MTQQIEAFVQAIQAKTEADYAICGYKNTPTILAEIGPKYARLVKQGVHSRDAIGFIEVATGNVLKADGWKRPAKGVRGNLADMAAALGRYSIYGGIK